MPLKSRAFVFWLTEALVAAVITAIVVSLKPPPGAGAATVFGVIVGTWAGYAALAIPAAVCHVGAVSLWRGALSQLTAGTNYSVTVLSAVLSESALVLLPAGLFGNILGLVLSVCVVPFAVSVMVLAGVVALKSRSSAGAA